MAADSLCQRPLVACCTPLSAPLFYSPFSSPPNLTLLGWKSQPPRRTPKTIACAYQQEAKPNLSPILLEKIICLFPPNEQDTTSLLFPFKLYTVPISLMLALHLCPRFQTRFWCEKIYAHSEVSEFCIKILNFLFTITCHQICKMYLTWNLDCYHCQDRFLKKKKSVMSSVLIFFF